MSPTAALESVRRAGAIGQKPSLTVCSLAPQPQRPVRQCSPCFVAEGAAKRKRLFTRAARKETALYFRSAIMPILLEVAPYDFRP
ncbi:hypothetical protein GCM10011400_39310 [Paraburkholderia caffeinilytica]|uniref:Uncharacterized protein n=1 Tax=Paraburkholderia caffeinilytica TaxID=1761016 RepID=A0ABQ1MW69_9BURK|nr:hypothetical protein GCM10011400_39310 [Paraburkholderia caffeinilytica]